jgi:hypothetical protein
MLRQAPLLFSLLLVSCAGTFTYVPPDYPLMHWNVGSVEVVLRDERANTKASPPAVPAVTLGGGEGADVRLPSTFSQFVQYRLGQVVSGQGPAVKLEITVKRARAEWSAGALSEAEKAEVTLGFRVFSSDGVLLAEGVGEGKREFSSSDASDEELAAVFRAACGDALDQYLGNGEVIRKLNGTH